MISYKNTSTPDISQVPSDWPYRTNSKMVNANNLTWHVQIFKKEQKQQRPLFLLIHGTGGAVHSWNKIVENLHSIANLILVDLPGHGFTQENYENDYSLAKMAYSLKNLLEVLEIEFIDLVVGHSAGAAVAIELCFQNDLRRVNSLIGINPSLIPPPVSYNMLLRPWISPVATSNGLTSILSLITKNTSLVENLLESTGSKLNPDQKKLYKRIFSNNNHLKGAIKFMASTDLVGLLNKSKYLKIKSTFILGKEDPWIQINPLKKIISKHFPCSKIIENSGGHLMHETYPVKISKQILETFIES
jgi:magnesium chelatase accessory protein